MPSLYSTSNGYNNNERYSRVPRLSDTQLINDQREMKICKQQRGEMEICKQQSKGNEDMQAAKRDWNAPYQIPVTDYQIPVSQLKGQKGNGDMQAAKQTIGIDENNTSDTNRRTWLDRLGLPDGHG